MKLLIKLLIGTLIVTSCSNNNSTEVVKSMNEPNRPIKVLKKLALNEGDIDAYNELETAYLDYEHGSFLNYAKEMADKHNYPQAYYDTYIQLLKPTDASGVTINLDSCDLETRELAIKYLRRASELGFEPGDDALKYLEKEGYIK